MSVAAKLMSNWLSRLAVAQNVFTYIMGTLGQSLYFWWIFPLIMGEISAGGGVGCAWHHFLGPNFNLKKKRLFNVLSADVWIQYFLRPGGNPVWCMHSEFRMGASVSVPMKWKWKQNELLAC